MWRTVMKGVLATLLASTPALAQTGTITGRVTSAEGGAPLPRVQVTVAGTSAGTLTRDDGRYTLTIRPGTYTVRAARIGLARDSVPGVVVRAGGTATADFQLRGAAAALSGVVVIGYGTQQARDVTGSLATVDSTQFNTGRIVSPEGLIRGKVAGVQVSENNEPGGGISIRVRGGTSVNASNEPLYVIDGVPVDIGGGSTVNGRNGLNFLNPNDIESVTVLKDASSTAIYGNRGANGVVIITTKSGSSGPQLTYTGTVSGSHVTGGPDLLTAAQFRTAVQTYANANYGTLGSTSTDWLGAIEQDAGGQEHNLGFSGRRQSANYRIGLGYLDQKGVLIGTKTQRTSASLNYNDLLLNDNLSLRTHIRGSRSVDDYTPGGVLGSAIAFDPTRPIYNADGSYYQYRDASGKLVSLAPNNPIEQLKYIQDQGNILRSLGNIEGEYKMPFLSGLTATLRGGYDINRADRNGFTPTNIASQLKADSLTRGSISRANHSELHTVGDLFANYRRDLPVSTATTLDLTAGVSAENFTGSYNGYSARGLSSNLLGVNGVPNFTEASPGVSVQEHRLRSQFGRANLSIADRYLITGTVRRDGSSRFGEGQKYGVFPSAAFAWRVLQEPMFKDMLPLSDLKFRLSWGKNGNEAIGCNYCAYGSYVVGGPQAQAQFGNTFVTTIRPVAFDPNLHWETTTSTNVGVDLGVLADRITGSVDFYTKTTDDLLFTVPTAAGTALSNNILTNIGSVRNRGLEFMVDARVIQGRDRAFTWNANFNAARNSNELLTIGRPGLTSIQTGGIAGGVGTTIQVLQAGQPVNSFWVYQHRNGANGKPVAAGADTAMYVDVNGDHIINTLDRVATHSPAPKWIFGHTSNMTWNGFDASTTLRAYTGNYVYNNVASNLGNYSVLTGAFAPVNLHASVLENGFTSPQYLSDLYVEDASFLRMDNITLGYTFARLMQMQNARIFGTVQNVFTRTKYSGVDPTASINGIDNNVYPRSRTFVGGLSVGF